MKIRLLFYVALAACAQLHASTVVAPAFSPAEGMYSSAQSVAITTTTTGGSIRYTTDGVTTPTETVGTLYSGSISIGVTTTLKAIAYETGYTDSTVSIASYTINLPQVAAPAFSPIAGTYTSAPSVTITSTTSGASIRYTIGGAAPTSTTGTVYSGPVSMGATGTLQAIAYKTGYNTSSVTSGTYTIGLPNTFPATGNVGIGTTTPGANLTVMPSPDSRNVFNILNAAGSQIVDVDTMSGEQQLVLKGSGAGGQLQLSNNGNTSGFLLTNTSATPAQSILQFTKDTTPVMTIINNGNVGIGTTAPASDITWASPALDISGTRGTEIIRTTAANGIATFRMTGPGANHIDDWDINMAAGSASTFSIYPQAGSVGSAFTITNTGNVGIGTATPLATADVAGALRLDNRTTQANYFSTLTSRYDSTHPFSLSVENNTGGTAFEVLGVYSPSGGGHLNLALGLNGNVGIGTMSPVSKLDARGGITAATTDYVAGTAGSNIQIQQTAFTGNNPSYLQAYTAGATAYGNIGLDPQGGNVGIGTTTPAAKLDVAGNANVQGNLSVVGTFSASNFSTTGTTSFKSLTTTGNVGIGTASPATNLQVGSGTFPVVALPGIGIANGPSTYSFFSASDNTHQYMAGIDPGLTYGKEGMISNHDLAIETNNTPRIYITNTGNVGIGTTAPASDITWASPALDISGTRGTEIIRTTAANGIATFRMTGPGANHIDDWDINMAAGSSSTFSIYPQSGNVGSAFTITNTGNVGIGTTNPQNSLDVRYGITAATTDFVSGTAGTEIQIGPDASTGNTACRLQAYTAGATAFGNVVVNPFGGNVGIGTTTPSLPLDVKGPNTIARFESNAASALIYFTPSGQKQWRIGAGSVNTGDFGIRNDTDGIEAINVSAAGNVAVQGNLSVAGMFSASNFSSTGTSSFKSLTTTGSVGIGTVASSQDQLSISNGPSARTQFILSDGNTASLMLAAGNSKAGVLASDVSLQFRTGVTYPSADNGGTTAMTILPSGNVGIGMTTPTYKLDVNGTIHASEVLVDTTGADYVFKPAYKLASLSEVEGAIKRDGHLPGIPSAQEMSSRGVNVGDLQTKLLAKVEELTLLMIQQDKKVQQQSQELQELKAENAAMQARLNTMAK
jgi:hypothetical protein